MQYMIKKNDNFDEIHTYFNQNNTQLKALGQFIEDVYTILFDAYVLGMLNATYYY